MPARTASSSTSAALGALALGLLALGAGCNTQAPASSVPAEALCPDTMKGDGTAEFPLSGLTIIRFETGKGSANVTPAGDESRQEWLLPPAPDVYYRAACEYDEEIIGVPIEADIRRCWLERKPGNPVTTGCQKG